MVREAKYSHGEVERVHGVLASLNPELMLANGPDKDGHVIVSIIAFELRSGYLRIGQYERGGHTVNLRASKLCADTCYSEPSTNAPIVVNLGRDSSAEGRSRSVKVPVQARKE